MARLKVYYNSACPVCDAGIRQQRQKLSGCDVDVEWIDVHQNNAAVTQISASLEEVRERLHVVDESGSIKVGSEAFSTLWNLTPGQRQLARLTCLPVIRQFCSWAYNCFAAALYRWNRRKGRW